MIFWAVVGALFWCGVLGKLSWANALAGAVVGLLVWVWFERSGPKERPPRVTVLFRLLLNIPIFLWDLLRSNLEMARLVLKPHHELEPAILEIPIEQIGDAEILVAGHWITLTPGTMTMDVSDDKRTLYVHFVQCRDPESAKLELQKGPIQRVRRMFKS